jgi:uncharacterized protein
VSRALLDVNVLLALLDADHVDHVRATAWFVAEQGEGWASCAVTENGFVRIISQPRYPSPVSVHQAASRLAQATRTPLHEFWPCQLSLLDPGTVDTTRVHGSRQVTDAYLLALAVSRGGRFVTFDQSVALDAVPSARSDHLLAL